MRRTQKSYVGAIRQTRQAGVVSSADLNTKTASVSLYDRERNVPVSACLPERQKTYAAISKPVLVVPAPRTHDVFNGLGCESGRI
jgi:hypothetical protein